MGALPDRARPQKQTVGEIWREPASIVRGLTKYGRVGTGAVFVVALSCAGALGFATVVDRLTTNSTTVAWSASGATDPVSLFHADAGPIPLVRARETAGAFEPYRALPRVSER